MSVKLETIYPVTSMQEGMLFHSLYAPESGIYVEHLSCRLRGRLDVSEFERSWQYVVDRHCALRSSFVWDGVKEPVQVIQLGVRVQIERLDWRQKPREAAQKEMKERLARERKNGFQLDQAPLMKLTLFQIGEEEYEFAWLHHHLLIDGWSLAIVLGEVFDCYLVFREGREANLPPPANYKEYVHWRKRQDLKRAERFWRNKLRGFRTPTAAGIRQLTPTAAENGQTAVSGEVYYELSGEETHVLRNWAMQNQLTLNAILQGAWAVFLSRYSGGDDVVFGATVAGRPADVPGMDKLVGLFINTLPVRTQFEKEKSVLCWLQELQNAQAEAREYEYSPLAAVQGWSEVGSGRPLFETIVVFENYPVSYSLQQIRADAGLRVTDIKRATQTNYGIVLAASLESDHLKLQIGYDRTRYDGAAMDRMLAEVANLLGRIPESSNHPLGSLSLLDQNAQMQTLRGWNSTFTPYPRGKYAHQLFEDQADRTPEETALECGENVLSYRELNQKANQLANYLKEMGVNRGSLIAVFVERSCEMVVSLIGIMKAGAAYVPLDTTYPEERLKMMLEDAQPAVMLTREKLLPRLPQYRARVVCLDRDGPGIASKGWQSPRVSLSPEDLAYVIYTSGSTGKPKGAMNTHGGLRNHLLWRQATFPLGLSDRILQRISISFDPSVWEIWGPLVAGARLILSTGPTEDLHYVAGELLKHKITVFQSPPPIIQMLLDIPEFSQCACLRSVLCGAESLTRPLQERFYSTLNAELHNLYGPSEGAVDATWWKCERSAEEAIVPIGRPVANVQMYVLGADLEPAPVGVAGELYIGGVGLARGYLNRPELTAQQFVANPFSDKGGERLYKTGDLARWRPDGALEFLGRLDQQVKVRGFRIELGEIEAVLGRHEDVEQAVVVKDDSANESLIAYVVPRKHPPVADRRALRRYLRAKLPEYMVPSAFVKLDALPLTRNGKIDRGALPRPDSNLVDARFEAPRTPIEEMLAAVWAEVLGIERIGIRDNFFDLGGHSLLATRVISRIRKHWRINVSLQQLFEEPTVAGLAGIIDEAQRRELCRQIPAILPAPRDKNLPLSFAQQRLWFLEQLRPGNSIPVTVRLEGMLDVAALQHSLNAIVRRHEVLRTVFPAFEGRAVQVIKPAEALPLRQENLEDLAADEQNVSVGELLGNNEREKFDLNQGPLLRGLLIHLNDLSHILQVTMHHIVCDGWSMAVLARELRSLYEAYQTGQECQLPELKIQYADYAVWQREWTQGEALQVELKYWVKQLAGVPRLELPGDYERSVPERSVGGFVARELPSELSRGLKKMAREQNATVFMVLMALWQVLLWRYTGQREMAVGTPVANRNREEIEGLIGFFVNTLVLRGRIEGGESFRELLKRVKETALGAYTHQDVPFERVVEELQPDRDLNRTPLFQAMLVLQNAPAPQMNLGELTMTPMERVARGAQYDLTLEVAEKAEEQLQLGLHYRGELYENTTMERMLGHYQEILAAAIKGAERQVRELRLLRKEEERQLLEEWNATQTPFPRDACIQELFEQQVERSSEAVAVRCDGSELTFGQLNERANQLAHYLRQRGVGPEALTGICVERSLVMIVGIIAILKAGGAYVPLDPEYPEERLDFMLRDTQMCAVLTESRRKGSLPPTDTPLILLDSDDEWECIASYSKNNPRCTAVSDNLAYVMYTSGSTGMPKGVCIPHRAVTRLVKETNYIQFGPQEVFLQLAPVSFDASTLEIWGSLLNGAKLVLMPPGVPSIADITQALSREKVSTLWLTAGLFHAMVNEQLPGLKKIKQLLAGGDVLSRIDVEKFLQMEGSGQLINGYGPTENTTFTCCHSVCEFMNPGTSVPIGKPIANTSVYVLDQEQDLAPVGVVGELYAGGAGLARGYLHQPDLTADRFVPDPFAEQGGARMYRTGDLARWRADGSIEFVGRNDSQVKIRGFRIELGEIEARLAEHPMVRDAVVTAREDVRGEKRLVAYYTVDDSHESGNHHAATKELLRSYLSTRLPEYMVPAAYVRMEAMPLTPNGKLERKTLPLPEDDAYAKREYEAPTGEVDRVLAAIWSELLQVQRVGIHDNFFELGGDSILSIQAVARANQAGLAITARQMLEEQTIAGLARAVRHARAITSEEEEVTGPSPLTPIQHWFFEQDWPRKNHFNQAVLLEPLQQLDPKIVRGVVETLLQRHDALRMRYRNEGGTWRQESVAREEVENVVVWVDLSNSDADRQTGAVTEEAEKWHRSLDVEHGPLLRFVVMQLRGCQRLLVVIHHLVVDGVSWRILLDDFENAYRQLSNGDSIQLGCKTTSFKNWAERLKEYSQSSQIQEELRYWKGVLQPTMLDSANAKSGGPTSCVSVALDVDSTRILTNEMPTACQASILEILLTGIGRALSSWDSGTVLVDLEAHGREDVIATTNVSRTVGWFTTMFPVRLHFERDAGPTRDLQSVKKHLRGIPNHGLGFGLLRHMGPSDVVRQLKDTERPTICLNYAGQLDQMLANSPYFAWAEESSGTSIDPSANSGYTLIINVEVKGSRLHLHWSYRSDVHRTDTIRSVAQEALEHLRSLIIMSQSTQIANYLASDFPLAHLKQDDLDDLLADLK